MNKNRRATIGVILCLLATACERTTIVDTSPIGNGLAVIGVGLVVAAWIHAMF
jgi:hypothetical protein